MPIRFRCKCGKILKVEEHYAGRSASCPNCGAQLVVPGASTSPETEGENASAVPLGQPPRTEPLPPPADDLELESELSLPGAGAADAVEEVEELTEADTVEEIPAGDTVEEVSEVEEIAPESEISEVEPSPAAPAPAHAPAGQAAEKTCPNCGVVVAPGATICGECGANLMPGKAPAKKTTGIAHAFQSLRKRKAFPLIAGIAALIVILIVAGVILKLRKPKPHAPVRPVAVAQGQAQPAPAAKAPEKSRPPAEPTFRWPGFSDPAATERDRILKVGQELAAFTDRNHQPPATLADAGATEADSAEFGYVGPEIAALPRFRAMAYDAKPSKSFTPYMLFSDNSARPVPAAQTPADLLKKTESGWVSAADAALLAKTAPVIRVANVRFASLEVALDGQPAVVVPRGTGKANEWSLIPAAAGAHEITFTAAEKKESFQADLKPGVAYVFIHPWQADLPWIPIRQYRSAILGQASPFSVDKKEGYTIKSLKGPDENVDFLEGDGRTALASDSHSLTARITRLKENWTIEGLPEDKLIRINAIGRLEAGVAKFSGDITVTFRKTALGTLRCEELPNTDPAALSLPEGWPGNSAALKAGATPRWVRRSTGAGRGGMPGAARRNPRLSDEQMSEAASSGRQAEPGGQAAPKAPPPPPQLAFPPAIFTLSPDCEAIAPALSSAAPAAIELLLQRAQLEMSAAAAPAPPGRGLPPAREMPPPGESSPGFGRRNMNPTQPTTRRPVRLGDAQQEEGGPRPQAARGGPAKTIEVVERPLHPQEIPAPLVYGALALYGDPSTFHVLSEQSEKMPAESPAYPQLLLALGRSGGPSALAYLRTASENAPAPAVIALCTIDDAAARNATAEIIANWTPADVTEAVDEWPAVAGPTCRIAFVEAVAAANPTLLDDMDVLNALMKLDAFTLERVLVTRFEGEFNRPSAAPQQPQAPPQKALAQRSLRYTGPPRARRNRPLGESPVPGAAAARSGAPLSWIALAHFKNSAAVARFVQLLDGRDPTKRPYAVEALGEVHEPSLVPLLTALLQDKQAAVRQTAAKALVEAPDADIVGALNKAMDKDLLVSAIVEQAPAMAAKVGAEATASLLAKMLTAAATKKAFAPPPSSEDGPTRPAAPPPEDPNIATPVRIMGALIRLGLYSPEVKTAFEAARESPDPSVRVAAYRACAQEFAGADAAERSASLVAAAGAALKDKESTVRCAGIGLLSAAEPSEALPLLLPALKAPEADVRAAALSALPETDDPRIVAAITSSLADPNPLVVAAAARAAARRHDPALGVAVLAVLNQVGSKLAEQPAAGQASQPGRPAFSMRGSPAQPAPAKAMGDQSGIMVAALADAAADLQPQAAAGALANLLAYSQPEVRIAAVHALGRLKDSTALNSLLSCLQDRDPSVLSAAIIALGEFDSAEAVQDMLDTLGRSTLAPELRRQILTRLANHCADPSSAYGSWAATGTALKDSDLDILVSMAPTATGDERAGLIALATRYLADAHPETRKRAASILGNYTDDESVRTKLLSALEQDAAGVAPAAADVLRRIRDNSMIDVPLLAYYKDLAEPSGSGGTPAPAAAPLRTMPMGRGMANAPLPPPVPAAPAPAGPKYPGLLKASQTENAQLRTAIIEALGAIGGDHAGKALRTIADLEQKRNSDEMTPKLIAAFESVKGATSARDLCDCYVISPGRYRLDAIAVLARLGPFDSTHVADTLKRLAETAATPPDVAAASVDALDELGSAGGGA